MSDLKHGPGETAFARERLREILAGRGLQGVGDRVSKGDGWRCEFFSDDKVTEGLGFFAHKPDGAPFVTLGGSFAFDLPENVEEILELLELASEFDLALSFGRGRSERSVLQLSGRLPVAALNVDDIDFHLNTLLHARDALLDGASNGEISAP